MAFSSHIALAESIVLEGFDRHAAALAALVTDARRTGVDEVLVDIVADASAPRVVRERALGRIVVALDGSRRLPPVRLPHLVVAPAHEQTDHVDVGVRACA